MSEKVLVVGGTGMLGRPVAERLKEDGFDVTIMSSNPDKAKQMFGGKFGIVEGDVTKPSSLKAPLSGKEYLYINLSAHMDPVKYQKIEIEGTTNLAKVSFDSGIKRIMNISGASSRGKEIGVIYMDGKVIAERALIDSGVNYTVMRPSWFFESLPLFVQNVRASIIGHQPGRFHWLAASDFAKQVSRAFRTEAAANKCFYNFGPDAMTMKEALQKYCKRFHPNLAASEMPFWLAKGIAMLTGNKSLKLAIPFFEYFAGRTEDYDSSEADAILGKNSSIIDDWLDQKAANY